MNAATSLFRTRGERRALGTEQWPCSPRQRLYIRVLMQDCGLATDRVTVAHRRFFRDADIPQPIPDQRIDAVLAKLTVAQAKALTRALMKESSHEPAL